VPGLFAAGADTGGLYRNAYAGGVAPAVVFGLAAADAIAPTHSALTGPPATRKL
jgi:succinate dehydrogenase/fumarate reductase flavoprotein subunit